MADSHIPRVTERAIALDVLRGFVMLLMLAEVLHLSGLGRAFPDNLLARFIAFHTSHVEWAGCSLHDLIQPAFSFLAGASLPFSIAARTLRGQTFFRMFAHAAGRALLLVALGIVLRSFGASQTNFTFEDTLTQIGLGYIFLFLLAFTPLRVQVAAVVVILFGYWVAFASYPAQDGIYTGFEAHWNKNTNAAWAFDRWFLNLFPREKPFEFNRGGYSTLSFIPTLGTMLIGLLAGEWLRRERPILEKVRGVALAGAALFAASLVWHFSGTGPIVKRIWTPSFTLCSAGLVLLMLAAIYWIVEWKRWCGWTFPLIVIGSNSIVAYMLAHLFEEGLIAGLNRHLGLVSEPVVRGAIVLAVFWLILRWMYERKIFLRI